MSALSLRAYNNLSAHALPPESGESRDAFRDAMQAKAEGEPLRSYTVLNPVVTPPASAVGWWENFRRWCSPQT